MWVLLETIRWGITGQTFIKLCEEEIKIDEGEKEDRQEKVSLKYNYRNKE